MILSAMSALRLSLLGILTIAQVVRASPSSQRASVPPIFEVTSSQWASLNSSVSGRLHQNYPLGLACYSSYSNGLQPHSKPEARDPNLAQCSIIGQNKSSGTYLASQPNGYVYGDISVCHANEQGCSLKFSSPDDPLPIPGACYQGTVPDYYIDVRNVSDVQKGLAFASAHDLPLVIKNTGHDHKGRSAGPNSFVLW
jgi:hypothetical protein